MKNLMIFVCVISCVSCASKKDLWDDRRAFSESQYANFRADYEYERKNTPDSCLLSLVYKYNKIFQDSKYRGINLYK